MERVAPVAAGRRAGSGGRRRVERHEHRVQVVVAVGPPADDGQRQVELGRREPDDRREPAGRGRSRSALARPRPRRSSPIGPSASRRASHSPTASVCGRRSGAIPAAARAAVTRAGVDRELARQHVVDHLAALAEGGLDQPPELVLVVRVEAVVGVVRLDDDDRRLDRRLRLEGRRRARARRSGPGRGTARRPTGSSSSRAAPRSARRPRAGPSARAGRGRGGCAEERVQDRARDVVRQVGDDVVGRLDERGRGPGRARRPR